ncbi:MAG: MFS transporter [Bryobacteraceae bacterium]|nr:MFS transporter [Bryobacteraceae bacterium]MDW8378645.1 MFS transporter [Bryobacterales bacterium]
MPSYSRREQRGWLFYDWANSAFYTTVVTLFFGPYLTSLAQKAADAEGFVRPLGVKLAAVSVWPYLVSLSVLIQVFILPLAGAIADYGNRKRELLGALAWTGAAATTAMYWLEGDMYLLGCGLFLIANSAFGASIVVYNSFLPEIAGPEQRDAVSSKGFALGYVGGGVLLVANIFLYQQAPSLGLSEALAVRISLASAGLWWALFTVAPVLTLKNRPPRKQRRPGLSYGKAALGELAQSLREIKKLPQTLRFLLAYLVYNDAIQTILALASQFGQQELKLPVGALTTAILIAQFVGIGGAMFFNWVAARVGNKNAVMVTLVIYCAVLIYAYAGVATATEFYVMAGAVGGVMGGSQALSRSIFSFMIPKGHEAEYYSIYEISDKGTSWVGPLFFGLALQFTGSYRLSILSLIVFFVVGMLLLATVNVRTAALQAGNEPPPR